MLEPVYSDGSNPLVRKNMWVRIPPAAPKLPVTHPAEHVRRVQALAAEGRNPCEIERITGISRSTLRGWLDGSGRIATPPWIACPRCNAEAELDAAAYVYLLGLYLGDGSITKQPKGVWRLRITQTARYVELIEECAVEMQAVLPNAVGIWAKQGGVDIGSSSKHWPCLFPQHGPGRKHERPIVIAQWQQELVDAYPRLLLRGLIQSDGCRDNNFAITRGKRYEYPRYSFSNASTDILSIFTNTCDRLGVHWTQPSARYHLDRPAGRRRLSRHVHRAEVLTRRYDPAVARTRRRFVRLSLLSAVVAGLLALRDRKVAENQQRFNLP